MRSFALVSAVCAVAALAPISAMSQGTDSKPQPLKCEIGPVMKNYGATQWLVYSCDDGRSMVIVTAPGNPAMPFYFMFHASGDGYQLSGEGTGSKATTDAAFNELKMLSQQDIAVLIEQTKRR